MRGGQPLTRALGIVGLCALILAGCAGFGPSGTTGGAPTPTITRAPNAPNAVPGTATPISAPTLDWRTVHLPAGVNIATAAPAASPATAALAVSPVNGRVAWLCAPAANGIYVIWRTQDEAATWRQIAALQPQTQLPVTGCLPMAGQGDADTLAVNFLWGVESPVGDSPHGLAGYFTADSGAHWTRTPNNQLLQQVTTIGATTYALTIDLTSANSNYSLVASVDHLASWRVIASPLGRPTPNVEVWFSANPSELIWDGMNSGQVYHSSDGGDHWARIPAPAGLSIQPTAAAWRGQQAGWLVCAYANIPAATPGPPGTRMQCSADLGKTWTVIPNLTDTWSCGHCADGGGPASGSNACIPSVMSNAGALYALCGHDPQDTVSTTPQPPLTLSVMAPGATSWTTIGQAPCIFGTQPILTQTGQVWLLQPSQFGQLGPDLVLDHLP